MTQQMNLRLKRFEHDFKDIELGQYFQLKNIHIDKVIQNNNILLTVHFNKKYKGPFLNILPELNNIIFEYLNESIEIKIKIQYSNNYPFTPPIWYIKGVKHNNISTMELLDYYIYKIKNHNELYNAVLDGMTQWNPAIGIEKDILLFLERINHFEEILVCAR